MKTASLTFEQVYQQLEDFGHESVRRLYAKQGAGANQFGVKLGDLRGLAKKLKKNHPLALQLWASGNSDAMILATMVMDPGQLTAADAQTMAEPLTYAKPLDELVGNVLVHTPFAEELRLRWMNAPEGLLGRAGWQLLVARITRGDTEGLDYDALLAQIEAEILTTPKPKQEVMNRVLAEIGIQTPNYRQRCIELGERLGRFDDRPVHKGCTSPYVPEWIAAVLNRQKK